jgi:hypothetical protein
MPHVTSATARGFSLDPRALDQLEWLTVTGARTIGAAVPKSVFVRFAIDQLTRRMSQLVGGGDAAAVRQALETLPAFARCAPAGAPQVSAGECGAPWADATDAAREGQRT